MATSPALHFLGFVVIPLLGFLFLLFFMALYFSVTEYKAGRGIFAFWQRLDSQGKIYLGAFLGLAALTIIEIYVGLEIGGTAATVLLLLLALFKGAAVAAFYMHLYWESWALRAFVLLPLPLAFGLLFVIIL